MKKIISLFLAVLFLTGCWDYVDLSLISIATGYAIDKVENGYEVTFQLVNVKEVIPTRPSEKSPVTIYKEEGKTIFEALRRLSLKVPQEIFVGHIKTVIISEEIAKDDIKKVLDILARKHEFRYDIILLVAKGVKAGEILGELTATEDIPVNEIISTIEANNNKQGVVSTRLLYETLNIILSDKTEIVLDGITIETLSDKDSSESLTDVDPSKILKLTGLAIFKDDKFIDWLSEEYSMLYNSLMGLSNTTYLTIPCSDGHITLDILENKIKKKIKENNINFNIKPLINIAHTECYMDFNDLETLNNLEKEINNTLEQKYLELLNFVITNYNSDIFNFSLDIYRSNPNYWKKHIKDNPNYLTKLNIKIKVNSKLIRKGTSDKSLRK